MGYFMFMQEQRATVPGWINKPNSELQLLCDPLWKKLTQVEKAKYKQMKKSLKQKKKQTKKQAILQPKLPVKVVKQIELEGIHLPIRVLQVERPDYVWVLPDHTAPEVRSLLGDLAKMTLEVLEVKELTTATFTCDGKMYLCRVAEKMLVVTRRTVITVKDELVTSLASLAPLAVRVNVSNMVGVRNTDRNNRRIEKKLQGGKLTMILNKAGAASFYKDKQEIVFRKSNSQCETSSSGSIEQDLEKCCLSETVSVDEGLWDEVLRDYYPQEDELHREKKLVMANNSQSGAHYRNRRSCKSSKTQT